VKQIQEAMPKVPVQKICRLFGVPRSSFYFRSTKVDPLPVQKQVAEVAGRFPNFGVEGLTGQLRFEKIKFDLRKSRMLRANLSGRDECAVPLER
jgi:hypothetical protein